MFISSSFSLVKDAKEDNTVIVQGKGEAVCVQSRNVKQDLNDEHDEQKDIEDLIVEELEQESVTETKFP